MKARASLLTLSACDDGAVMVTVAEVRLMDPVVMLMVRISRLERLMVTPVRRLSSACTRTISWVRLMMLIWITVRDAVREVCNMMDKSRMNI